MQVGFTVEAEGAWDGVVRLATAEGHECIETACVLLGWLNEPSGWMRAMFEYLNVDAETFEKATRNHLEIPTTIPLRTTPVVAVRLSKLLAVSEGQALGESLSLADVLAALASDKDGKAGQVLKKFKLSAERIYEADSVVSAALDRDRNLELAGSQN